MKIGARVKMLREKQNMTQQELAYKLGYKAKSSVTHIERGRDIPRSMVVKLAEVLNTTPAYLMGWEDEDKNENSPSIVRKNADKLYDELMDLSDAEVEQIRVFAKYLRDQRNH